MQAPWILLVGGSLLGGASLVALMIVPRKGVWLLLSMTLAGVIASFGGVFAVAMRSGRLDVSLVTALLGLIVFSLAYSLGTIAAPHLLRLRRAQAPDEHPQGVQPGAVVVVSTCLEPESYSPTHFAETLDELDQTGVSLPSWTARPMIFAAERARYRAAGGTSPARSTCTAIASDLADMLAGEERVTDVETAWCNGRPSLDEVMAQALADHRGLAIVCHLSVGGSLRADRARSRVDAVVPPSAGLRIIYTPPLWSSSALSDMVVSKTLAAIGDRPIDTIGVCLVGNGQPSEWREHHAASAEHETYFHQRIRARLEEAGVPGSNVRLAWLDWNEPDVTDTVRHLGALGCQLICVVPSSMPVETLGTLVDLRQAVHFARVPDSAEVLILDAWGRDPIVAEELAKLVRTALGELPA